MRSWTEEAMGTADSPLCRAARSLTLDTFGPAAHCEPQHARRRVTAHDKALGFARSVD